MKRKEKNFSIKKCPLCKWETNQPCNVCNGLGFVVVKHNKPQSNFEKKFGWSYFQKKVEKKQNWWTKLKGNKDVIIEKDVVILGLLLVVKLLII